MKYVLALDQGTTSSRAIVFDQGGTIKAVAQKEFTQHYPQPGWVEHDPVEIWSSQAATATEALIKAHVRPGEIAALGITNQRETTLLWDRATGQPLHHAIVWQDRRTAPDIDRLNAEGMGATVREKTGLVPDAYFSGSKLAWLLEHVPGARARAEAGELAFGTVDTWLIYQLTERRLHLTDVSNASRTMLFNIRSMDWDEDLLAWWKIPRTVLPEVRPSSGFFGEVTASTELRGIPIAGVAGDQQAALFGQLCLKTGMAKNTYGTGCFMLMNTGQQPVTSRNNLLTTVGWKIGQETTYALEGSVFIGGAVVQWLRDGLGLIRSSAEVETLARSVTDNGGVYLVPAFAGLGAPHWDQYARGTICGLTRGANAGHVARAALESISFQVADLADAMAADSGIALAELRVDGGAAANDLLLQIQADLLQTRLVRPKTLESTALGAAYLAGLATGVWQKPSDLQVQAGVDRVFEPARTHDQVREMRQSWRKAVERSKNWAA